MATNAVTVGVTVSLTDQSLAKLVETLQSRGYQVIAPALRDGAIVLAPVDDAGEIPAGWSATTAPGRYRLEERPNGERFAGAPGPVSLKPFTHPSETVLFEVVRSGGVFDIVRATHPVPRRAFLGIRPCDLAALTIQDRVLLGDRYTDSVYQRQRENQFLVVVNCTSPGETCFCASMDSGPEARPGADIVLTELAGSAGHVFVAEAASAAGADVLAELDAPEADSTLCAAAKNAVARARMGREVATAGLRESLADAFEHPRWEQVAERCLSCGNCTQACPTCFCSTVEDSSNVEGTRAWRVRKWDSCFTHSFSYIHGGSVRLSAKSRYRQWLTHKFAAWIDQFGTPGCVGCGRCITWCPVGIDITEELAALRRAADDIPAEGS